MKFVDDLYNLYRNHLTGDDEDVVEIVLAILEDHTRKDLQAFVDQMSDEELHQMITLYLIEMLKRKMAEEGLETFRAKDIPFDPTIH